MNSKPVKLSDIAKRLHYSTVTISKALRNHPDIAPSTIKKIKFAAEEMGYTPNIIARNLSSRKSNTIGVVVPKIAHFFFGSMIEEIYNRALEYNYEIILTVSQENAEREKKHIQTLMAMKVEGIIISISQETKNYDIFKLVEARGIPIVFVDRVPKIDNISIVSVDDRDGAFRAIEHAIKLGYKKIAHFAGYTDINIGRERYQGFVDAMEKHGLPINPEWVCHGGFGERFGYDSFMKLYKKNNLPDLIFTVTYPVALGVYSAAKEVGLKITEDIDIICFGNAKVQSLLSPPISCVNQPTDLLAKSAMELLMSKIKNPELVGINNIKIPTELILRETCITFNKN
ncbi:MAG: LacI family transcriptional regulator [Melioribacteraceae bacterium]|nr:LacI family transcriptional regulator [Melioribacteraceae bacterium]MCF8264157.1 LacI family transcriptional regulator [Melioribacteraceae bacterium]